MVHYHVSICTIYIYVYSQKHIMTQTHHSHVQFSYIFTMLNQTPRISWSDAWQHPTYIHRFLTWYLEMSDFFTWDYIWWIQKRNPYLRSWGASFPLLEARPVGSSMVSSYVTLNCKFFPLLVRIIHSIPYMRAWTAASCHYLRLLEHIFCQVCVLCWCVDVETNQSSMSMLCSI